MIRRLALAALGVLCGTLAFAQQEQRTFIRDYDLDSASYTYCNTSESNPSSGRVVTVGSSTTVTSTAGTPFDPLVVGDTIVANSLIRHVTAKASGSSLTVDAAVDWSNGGAGYTFNFNSVRCGTTDNDGWIEVGRYYSKTLSVEYNQGDLNGGLDVRWECKSKAPGALPEVVYPGWTAGLPCGGGTLDTPDCNFATANIGVRNRLALVIYEPYGWCRMGIKAGTSDPSDAGANLEQISGFLDGVTAR